MSENPSAAPHQGTTPDVASAVPPVEGDAPKVGSGKADAGPARSGGPGRTARIGAGVAIGSAAIVAALLYSRRGSKG